MSAAIAARMPNPPRLAYALISLLAVVAIPACASGDTAASPDAAIDISPAGDFSLHSSFVLTAPPPNAADVLAELSAATDNVDDPARYLVDRLVARLPEGKTRQYAESLAPYFAAYLQTKLDTIAPRFSEGIRELVEGTQRIAHRVETIEHVTISSDGTARREIEGLRWGPNAVDFTGIAPVVTTVMLMPPADAARAAPYERQLVFASHQLRVPFGALLRAGFDNTVIPTVVPRTFTLASALDHLVDCPRIGSITSEWMGIGSPELYATACSSALTSLAAHVYAMFVALDAEPFIIELSGVARAFDLDASGAMDRLDEGRWVGMFGTGTFEGKRR
jgi:hypothetical protein